MLKIIIMIKPMFFLMIMILLILLLKRMAKFAYLVTSFVKLTMKKKRKLFKHKCNKLRPWLVLKLFKIILLRLKQRNLKSIKICLLMKNSKSLNSKLPSFKLSTLSMFKDNNKPWWCKFKLWNVVVLYTVEWVKIK
jgi:hypothetical protein